eukprot:6349147-Ditylum_brightwellii.AAC.2
MVDPAACAGSLSRRPAYVERQRSRRAYVFVPGEVSAQPEKVRSSLQHYGPSVTRQWRRDTIGLISTAMEFHH